MRGFFNTLFACSLLLCAISCTNQQNTSTSNEGAEETAVTPIKVADDKRHFVTEDGRPFFWLGDTGWLLFSKLTKEEAQHYLETRAEQGFNVIQVMVLHSLQAKNIYGDSALTAGDVAHPNVSPDADSTKLNYWDLIDTIIDRAAALKIHMALVPVWGGNVKKGGVTQVQAAQYAKFLAERYKDKPNIVWLNGGDIPGSDSTAVWQTIGKTLRQYDPNHLITFHPMGRNTSSDWFHQEAWLDFNMFQSGHRRYEQDTSANEKHHFGEDNWRYVENDYALSPAKPTLDGEPSYEGIPQGLHDVKEPRWKDQDVRRYAYWSVFAGGAGFTYGNNSVMQFLNSKDKGSAYGATEYWTDAINNPGANQMKYLKELILSRPALNRVEDQSILAENGTKYNYQIATKGHNYIFVYTYTGAPIHVHLGKIPGKQVKASWFDPKTGKTTDIGEQKNEGDQSFDPPGEEKDGNDWVLVLDAV